MIEPCEEIKRVERRYEKALDDMEKHYKDMLKQIRAEIEQLSSELTSDGRRMIRRGSVFRIIDKHMAEKVGSCDGRD